MADGHVDEFEAVHLRKNGEGFIAQVAGRQASVGDGQLSVLSIEDIAERKEAAQRLQELNQQLDHRVRECTRELEATLEHLKQTQARLVQSEKLASLGSVVAAVARELNTPVGSRITLASSLVEQAEESERNLQASTLRRSQLEHLIQEQHKTGQLMMSALRRTEHLIRDFKHVAVNHDTPQRREHFELKTLVVDQLLLLKIALGQTLHEMEVEVPAGMRMDSYPNAIDQVLTNLINNAVKHGFAGREQGHMVLGAERQGDMVLIVFSDDGVGMNEEVRRRVFDPFFTTALGQGGSGLGMAVSYNLVTGPLAGSIEVDSEPGQGARFSIRLPLVAS